jgi:hypothetical protein
VHLLRYEELSERWSSLSSISERYEPTDFTKNKSMTAPEEIKDKVTSKPYTRSNHFHRQGEIYDCTGERIEALVLSQRFKCMSCGRLIDRYIYPREEMLPEWFKCPGGGRGTSRSRGVSGAGSTANNRSVFEGVPPHPPRAIALEDTPQQTKIECSIK